MIRISNVHGFCSGVRHALEVVTKETTGKRPVFVLHELVHNNVVIARLNEQGVRIVNSIDEVPSGAVLIFSAHGVSDSVEAEAEARTDLTVVDATCPLVKLVQKKARSCSMQGKTILLFGKHGHREVEGILGRIPGKRSCWSRGQMRTVFSLSRIHPMRASVRPRLIPVKVMR